VEEERSRIEGEELEGMAEGQGVRGKGKGEGGDGRREDGESSYQEILDSKLHHFYNVYLR